LRKKLIKLGLRKFRATHKVTVKSIHRVVIRQLRKVLRIRTREIRLAEEYEGKPEFQDQFVQITKCRPRYILIKRQLRAKIWLRREKAKFAAVVLRIYKKTQKWFKKQKKTVRYGKKFYTKCIRRAYRLIVQFLKTAAQGIKKNGFRWHVKYNRKKVQYFIKVSIKKTHSLNQIIKRKLKAILGRQVGKIPAAVKRSLNRQITSILQRGDRMFREIRSKVRHTIRLGWKLHKVVKLRQQKLAKALKKAGIRVAVKVSLKVKLQRIRVAKKFRKIEVRKHKIYIARCLGRVRRFQRQLLGKGRGRWLVRTVKKVLRRATKQHRAIVKIAFVAIKKRGLKWYKKYAQKKVTKVKKILRSKVNFIQRVVLQKTAALLRKKVKLSLAVIRRIVQRRVQQLLAVYRKITRRLTRQLKVFIRRGWRVLVGVRGKAAIKVKFTPKVLQKFATKFNVKKFTKKVVAANIWFSRKLRVFTRAKKILVAKARVFYKKNKKVGRWFIRRVKDDVAKKFIQVVTLLNKLRRIVIKIGVPQFKKVYKPVVRAKLSVLIRQLKKRVSLRVRQAKLVLRVRNVPAYKGLIIRLTKFRPRYIKIARQLSAKIWRRKVISRFGVFILRITRKTRAWYKKQTKRVRFGYKLYRPLINRCFGSFVGVVHTWYKGIAKRGFGWFVKYARKKFNYFAKVTRRKTVTFVKKLKVKSVKILGMKKGKLSPAVKRRFIRQINTLIKVAVRVGKSFYKKHTVFIRVGWKGHKAVKLAQLKKIQVIRRVIRREAAKKAGKKHIRRFGKTVVIPLPSKQSDDLSKILRYKIKGLNLSGRRGTSLRNIILNVHVPHVQTPRQPSPGDKVVCSCRRVRGGEPHYH
jgi:hypothetical protein